MAFSASFSSSAPVLQSAMGLKPGHQFLQGMFCVGGWSVDDMPGVDWPPIGILLPYHVKAGSSQLPHDKKLPLVQRVLTHHGSLKSNSINFDLPHHLIGTLKQGPTSNTLTFS